MFGPPISTIGNIPLLWSAAGTDPPSPAGMLLQANLQAIPVGATAQPGAWSPAISLQDADEITLLFQPSFVAGGVTHTAMFQWSTGSTGARWVWDTSITIAAGVVTPSFTQWPITNSIGNLIALPAQAPFFRLLIVGTVGLNAMRVEICRQRGSATQP